jgi:hypothetical protein
MDFFNHLEGFDNLGLNRTKLNIPKKNTANELWNKLLDELLSTAVRDEVGNVAKDMRGVDYYFVDSFITPKMDEDFPLIEHDFMSNCGDMLQEFNDINIEENDRGDKKTPTEAIRRRMLRLIYNGAKFGYEYCVHLMVYLYKTYHKAEYKKLRGYSELDPDVIAEISFTSNNIDTAVLVRILAMSDFMNIEIPYVSRMFYLVLNKKQCIEENKEAPKLSVSQECTTQINDWINEEKANKVPRKNKVYRSADTFIGACLKALGYPDDFAKLCIADDTEKTLEDNMAKTLAILRNAHPDKQYSFEDIQRYTAIYQTVKSLTHSIQTFDQEVRYITGYNIDEKLSQNSWFKPTEVENVEIRKIQDEGENASGTDEVENGFEDYSKDEYIGEITALRKKIKEKELAYSNLRNLYKENLESLETAKKKIEQYQSERVELIALREFAYKTDMEIAPITNESIDDMKNIIKDKKIVIIGGHVSWINKLKGIFPTWKYISPDAYKTVDGNMIEGSDRVYFFTDYLNHVTYGKFITIVREKGIPFDYLGNINMERLIRQIYADMQ